MEKQVTMESIALEAGVSISTVSRVLAGKQNVAEPTRKRIQELIDLYQFRPNLTARSLVRQQSNLLGVLVQNIENPYFASMYIQAERIANDLGYSAVLFNSPNAESELRSITSMRERQVDGILISTASIDCAAPNRFLESLEGILSPQRVIILNDPPAGYDGPWTYVSCLNEQAYSMATRYLISLGHRNIAFIGGSPELNLASLRLKGFRETMRDAGHEINPGLVSMLGYETCSGEMGMEQVLGQALMPSAVLAISDQVAMGVLRACMRQGLRVPQDISIISCDNTFIAHSLYPALTSIDISPEMQGEMAVRLLVRKIDGEQVPYVNGVAPRLVIRDSTARVL